MFLQYLKRIDAFAPQIQLRLGKNKYHKTYCGGVMSLLVFGCCLAACAIIGLEQIEKKNPGLKYREILYDGVIKTEESSIISQESVSIKDLEIKIGLKDMNGMYLDEKALKQLNIELNFVTKDKFIIHRQAMNLEKCTLEDFDSFSYTGLSHDLYYCIQDNKKYILEGGVSEMSGSYIEIKITCVEECSYVANKYPLMIAHILFKDLFLTSNNFDQPFTPIYRNKYMNFTVSSLGIDSNQNFDLQIKMNTVITDSGFFFPNLITQNYICFSSIEQAVTQSYQEQAFLIRIHLSTVKGIFERTYMTVKDFLVVVGGLMKALMVIGTFLVKPISKLSMNSQIVNELFIFEEEEDKKILKRNLMRLNSFHSQNLDLNHTQKQQGYRDSRLTQGNNQQITGVGNLTNQVTETNIRQSPKSKFKTHHQQESSQSRSKQQNLDISSNTAIITRQESDDKQRSKSHKNLVNNNINQKKDNNITPNEDKDEFKRNTLIPFGMKVQKQKSIEIGLKSISEQENDMICEESKYEEKEKKSEIELSKFIEDTKLLKKENFLIQGISLISTFLKRNYEVKKGKRNATSKQQKEANDMFCDIIESIKQKPLKFTFFEYIRYFFGNMRCLKKQKQIIYSVNKVRERLDIGFILKKLTEIDKLKFLLLSHQQQKLFEYMPKPIIQTDPEKQENNEKLNSNELTKNWSFLHSEKDNLDKLTEAFKAYREIITKYEKEPLDERLIQMLDPSVKRYFDLTQRTTNSPLLYKSFQPQCLGSQNKMTKEYNLKQNIHHSDQQNVNTVNPNNPISCQQISDLSLNHLKNVQSELRHLGRVSLKRLNSSPLLNLENKQMKQIEYPPFFVSIQSNQTKIIEPNDISGRLCNSEGRKSNILKIQNSYYTSRKINQDQLDFQNESELRITKDQIYNNINHQKYNKDQVRHPSNYHNTLENISENSSFNMQKYNIRDISPFRKQSEAYNWHSQSSLFSIPPENKCTNISQIHKFHASKEKTFKFEGKDKNTLSSFDKIKKRSQNNIKKFSNISFQSNFKNEHDISSPYSRQQKFLKNKQKAQEQNNHPMSFEYLYNQNYTLKNSDLNQNITSSTQQNELIQHPKTNSIFSQQQDIFANSHNQQNILQIVNQEMHQNDFNQKSNSK